MYSAQVYSLMFNENLRLRDNLKNVLDLSCCMVSQHYNDISLALTEFCLLFLQLLIINNQSAL